jgi:hypothetical protein
MVTKTPKKSDVAPNDGVQSRGLGRKAVRQIIALAAARGLEASRNGADSLCLAGRLARLKVAYSGYERLQRMLQDVEVCFMRFGRKGQWVALLPAESLMSLLEIGYLTNLAPR